MRTSLAAVKASTTVGIASALLLGASPADAATPPALDGYTVAGTFAPFGMIVHEDGSGQLIIHTGGGRITGAGTFGEGALPWECDRNGNRICGPNPHPSADQRSKATSWTTGTWTGTVYTDGRLTVRRAVAGDAGRFVTSR